MAAIALVDHSIADPVSHRARTRDVALAVLLLALTSYAFVPLIHPAAYTGGGEGVDSFTQLLWLALASACVVALFASRARRGYIARPHLSVLMLVCLACASYAWSVDPHLTIRRDLSLVATVIAGVYIASAFSLVDLVRLVRRFAFVATVASLVYAVVSAQAYDPYGKLRGVFFTKNQLGFVVAIGLVATIAGMLGGERRTRVTPALLMGGVELAVLVWSGDATSLLAAIAAILVLFIALGLRLHNVRSGALGATFLVLAAATIFVAAGGSRLVFDATSKDPTLTGRTRLWSALWHDPVAERPIAGSGYGAFWDNSPHERDVVRQAAWYGQQAQPMSAHNGYLELMLGMGPLGVALGAAAIVAAMRRGARGLLHLDAAAHSALLAMAVFFALYSLGEGDLFRSRALFTLLLVALTAKAARTPRAYDGGARAPVAIKRTRGPRVEPSIGRNSLWAGVGEVGRVVNQGLIVLLLARVLGAASFGRFDAATTLFQTAGPFLWCGAQNLLVQRRAQLRESLSEVTSTAITTVVLFGGIGCVLAITVLRPLLLPGVRVSQVAVLAVAELVFAGVTESLAFTGWARERMGVTAMIRWLSGFMRLGALLLLVALPGRTTETSWDVVYAVATAATALAAWTIVRRISRLDLAYRPPTRAQIVEGLSYSITGTAFMVQDGIDKPLVLRLASASAAGTYSAGYRAVVVALVPLRAVLMSTYARFFRVGRDGVHETARLARRLIGPCVAYALFAAAVMVVAAPLVARLFGPGFGDTASVVRWLALLPLCRAISGLYGDALTGAGLNRLRMRVMIGTAACNVIANVVLIPHYSWRGAAMATMGSESLLAFVLGVCVVASRASTVPLATEAVA